KMKLGYMKSYWLQIIALGLVVGVLSGCGNNNGYQGQVTGVQGREGYESVQPYGMVYIPSGNFIMGGSGEDLKSTFTARPKSVTVQGFYMDAGEVTNNQYRQFVYWVRDSIARELMGYVKDNPDGTQSIDWNQEINYNDPATMEQMNALYYTPEDRIWGKMEIDKSKLIYHSVWYELKDRKS